MQGDEKEWQNTFIKDAEQRAILKELKTLGGSASRDDIKQAIADDNDSEFSYEDFFDPVISRSGKQYVPFLFDFNFGVNNLFIAGYIEKPERGKDIILTEKGRISNEKFFPTLEEKRLIDQYWKNKSELRKARKKANSIIDDSTSTKAVEIDENSGDSDWKTELIDQLKKFSPGKFESFSRLLISKMGVRIDNQRGIIRSGDHSIDGFGYFQSDEFRTSRVAIQAKRFTNGSVGEPEIDKFKGVMDSFNAEYGIFITTSYFTDQAKEKAVVGNNSVTLIDGIKLSSLVQKYQLRV
ncbi:restriction endonuclease [Oenococcus oeni IOEB_C23]|nr:restriction endonuclease [Oenococcus oeni]KGH64751.1 restriction endonuclease [Oenococcus oeni IOEB_C23]